MRHPTKWLRRLTGFGALCGLAATIGIPGLAAADPINYTLLTTIPVPPSEANTQPGGAFTSFDISWFDPLTNAAYVADRSNAAVDIFSAASFSLIGRATGFTGQVTDANGKAVTSLSGPDGVLVANTGVANTLFAGNGNSTLLSFNVNSPASPTTLFPPVNTGGSFRVDEMAYSPTTHLLLAANNADTPAFGTLFNAQTGTALPGKIIVPGAVGLEQPVWNPNTGTFFISVPQFGADPANSGGVAEIKPDGTIGRIYDFSKFGIASCSPAGLALGGSGNLIVGCHTAGTQTVVLNPAGTGSIVTTIGQISGTDEIWYDPHTHAFYVTGVNAANDHVFDVIGDTSFAVLDSVSLSALGADVNAHSITVDLFNGDVFVPLEGTTAAGADALCPLGCIAVFAPSAIPEPTSLLLTLTALLGLAGIGWLRRIVR